MPLRFDAVEIAKKFIEHHSNDQQSIYAVHDDQHYRYSHGAYHPISNASFFRDVSRYVNNLAGDAVHLTLLRTIANAIESFVDISRDHHTNRPIRPGEWLTPHKDWDPKYLFTTQNAIIHIPTIEDIPVTPKLFNCQPVEYDYDPMATCNTWLHFLNQSLDTESIQTLQEWFGYSLIGHNNLEKIMVIIGPPGSGKSTACYVLEHLLGQANVATVLPHKLDERFHSEILLGKRAAFVHDARQSTKLKAECLARILAITGRDQSHLERKFKSPLSTHLNLKMTYVSNSIPDMEDNESGMERRLLTIHFKNRCEKPNPDLKDQLLSEIPGILNWAVYGAQFVLLNNQLNTNHSQHYLVKAVKQSSSHVADFLHDNAKLDPDHRVTVDDLYHAYQHYCSLNDLAPIPKHQLSKLVTSIYPQLTRHSNGITRSIVGLKMRKSK